MQPWAFTFFLTARDEYDFISWKLLLDQSSLLFRVWFEVACKSLMPVMLLLCVDISVYNLGNASSLPHILHNLAPVHILNDLQRWLLPGRLFWLSLFLFLFNFWCLAYLQGPTHPPQGSPLFLDNAHRHDVFPTVWQIKVSVGRASLSFPLDRIPILLH